MRCVGSLFELFTYKIVQPSRVSKRGKFEIDLFNFVRCYPAKSYIPSAKRPQALPREPRVGFRGMLRDCCLSLISHPVSVPERV